MHNRVRLVARLHAELEHLAREFVQRFTIARQEVPLAALRPVLVRPLFELRCGVVFGVYREARHQHFGVVGELALHIDGVAVHRRADAGAGREKEVGDPHLAAKGVAANGLAPLVGELEGHIDRAHHGQRRLLRGGLAGIEREHERRRRQRQQAPREQHHPTHTHRPT